MPFDPNTRRETWCFLRVKRGKDKVYYTRLPFNFVEYDGNSERVIEPVPPSERFNIDTSTTYINDPNVTGTGKIAGFEFFDVSPFEEGLHSF